jgi:hypothetical protein
MDEDTNSKVESLLWELDWIYTTAATPGAGWKAAWRWSGHASRRGHRRALYGRIVELAREFGTGGQWPAPSDAAQRGMERAFREIEIEGY